MPRSLGSYHPHPAISPRSVWGCINSVTQSVSHCSYCWSPTSLPNADCHGLGRASPFVCLHLTVGSIAGFGASPILATAHPVQTAETSLRASPPRALGPNCESTLPLTARQIANVAPGTLRSRDGKQPRTSSVSPILDSYTGQTP